MVEARYQYESGEDHSGAADRRQTVGSDVVPALRERWVDAGMLDALQSPEAIRWYNE